VLPGTRRAARARADLGCVSDQECSAFSENDVCRESVDVDRCLVGCQSTQDCADSWGGDVYEVYDASHFSCTAGLCQHTGCRSDQECQGLGASYVCRDLDGVPTCQMGCQSTQDCPDSWGGAIYDAYDASHFECDSGLCGYLGCRSEGECQAFGAGYVCRTPS
jgi:predicted alpha/beta hydrolase family esterase